ncbi:hypothetical protein Tco_0835319 [Tanacetum coccineum]
MQNVPYASVVGSIMYAVRCTRPDVVFAQNITSRFQQNPSDLHWTAIKNILKYLRNTKDMFRVYEGDIKRELRISCYTDAGYMTDADDLKSQTGYVFILNGGVVDWKSAKHLRLPFELEWDPLPNYTIGSSNSFEWRKIIFEMITCMGIRHAKAYTLCGRSSMKLGQRDTPCASLNVVFPFMLTQIPNNTTSERPPVITTVFAATTPENTPFAYRASTLANPNPMIIPAIVEANYEDYDGEREMEPRPEPNKEATPTLRLRYTMVRSQRERVVEFEEASNREGSRRGRNAEGIRPSEIETREDENKGVNLPLLLVVHLGRTKAVNPYDPL